MSDKSDSSTNSSLNSLKDATHTKQENTQADPDVIVIDPNHKDETQPQQLTTEQKEITTQADVHSPKVNSPKNSKPMETQHTEASQKPQSQVRFNFKVSTQMNRYDLMLNIFREASTRIQQYSLQEAKSTLSMYTDLWTEFSTAHQEIGETCSDDFLEHRYMVDNYHQKALKLVSDVKILMNTMIEIRSRPNSSESSATGTTHQQRRPLPEIELPKFSGDYSSWISFRDLFSSLVSSNPEVDGVQKMHYLKTSLEGEAAQLISNLPLTEDSFTSAWGLLTSRYENKRLLIASQMDKLFTTSVIAPKSASDLNALLTSTTEALNTLASLQAPVDSWDLVLVHFVSRRLDSQTREAWEVKLGSQVTPPTYQQLKSFLTGRARALENIQLNSNQEIEIENRKSVKTQQGRTSQGSATASSQSRPVKVLTVSHKNYGFECTCCKGSHFIVVCEKFRALSPKSRRELVINERLCFNCLGNHSAQACQSSKRCKECNGKHHTMIHSPPSGTSQQQKDSTQLTSKTAPNQNNSK